MSIFKVALRKADTLQRRIRRQLYQRRHPCERTTPVFIVGSQRSGTSMTLRVFDLSLDALVFNTQDPRAYERGMLHDPPVIQGLLRGSRATVTVFKPMHEIQRIPRFLQKYDGLKIVWPVRHYADVVNSASRMWPNFLQTVRAMTHEPENAGWHGESLTEHQRDVLREHFRDDTTLLTANALFWYVRNSFYFELGLEDAPQVRLFSYERMVQKPREQFAEIFDFCGCPFTPELTREIFDSSIGKNARPEIDPAVDELCQGLLERLSPLAGVPG
ncbi:MAG: hypothetical protein DWQ31_04825 [Planctomycetota bacterium]|nr:MAG: hypothetical protein DWQ31_04825 [Planctomycetota bacterium]REJ87861.1 MAG: hypothetical protein DWQ35_20710 [Planctomycetota bacterium]REK26437.1 MAG: hypothetical protein DWQ42_08920 [Planctomycetota bacterium]REK38725.1 MAG: hypothetical protein DWQ46_20055 [Planctomycetota bacterium]